MGNRLSARLVTRRSILAAAIACCASLQVANAEVNAVPTLPAESPNPYYVSNRAPLAVSPLVKLPIGAIVPHGWLAEQLKLERGGMAGQLEVISPFLKFEHNGWVDPKLNGGWEELPYWLKGYGDLGYVTGDKAIIAETKKWIDGMLKTQEPDGWFGPVSLKTSIDGKFPDLWPHMIVLNVLQNYYEFSHDERVLPFMTNYFRWQKNCPDEIFMKGYWPVMRVSDNVESIHWLYNRTGDAWLLDVATKVYKSGASWEDADKLPNWHGVNQSESFRAPAVYSEQSKDPKQLAATSAAYNKIREMYGNFPGGGWAADENCRPGYDDPRQGFETCSWVELMHSFEMLTKISADPAWADRNEEIAFNSLPAAMTADQKALRYFTAANMAQGDHKNKSPGIQNGGTMISYSPYEVFRCCQHNHGMGWPRYAEHLWLASSDGGLCASLYAPSDVKAKVGPADGVEVSISETTDYPWADTIKFTVHAPAEVAFPLYLRVPAWTKSASVTVNGNAEKGDASSPGYLRVSRSWKDGDVVELKLPMEIDVKRWHKESAGVSYGPINFSLQIGEEYKRYDDGKDPKKPWPEYDVFASTPFNYGLIIDDPRTAFTLTKRPASDQPFTHENAPYVIEAKAKRIPNWTLDKNDLLQPLQPSPIASDAPTETVKLIPAGAARLRITAFPVIGSGPDAKPWPSPPKPAFAAAASHVSEYDAIDAVADGIEPSNSHDTSISRFTWWDHRGTSEWVDAKFAEPRKVSKVQVYWFNDEPHHGDCREPASWRLMYLDGNAWKPVKAKGTFGTAVDAYNTLEFEPVTTTSLRIEAQLKPNLSAGILEWKVE